MDKLRAIECFIAVAEASSFSEAARRLGISAPSITRLINDLEEDLGVLLLHRTTRAVSLTEVGRSYLEDARSVLGELQTADDAAKGAHGSPQGTLRITASTMFGALHVAPIITTFLDRHPDVMVDALFLDRVVNIVDEDYDIAIRIGDLEDSSLVATRVGEVQLRVCGSPLYFERQERPKTPGDAVKHWVHRRPTKIYLFCLRHYRSNMFLILHQGHMIVSWRDIDMPALQCSAADGLLAWQPCGFCQMLS